MAVEFEDYSINVKNTMSDRIEAVLEECAGEMVSAVKRNSRVASGKTKNSFRHGVSRDFAAGSFTAHIGSNDENAIWEEFGTGEHAIGGNGRKGGWVYRTPKGEYYHTYGKKPSRAFWKAYTKLKSKIIRRIQNSLKGM